MRKKILEASGVPFCVTWKRVRHLNLRVGRPHGDVRVSAPLRATKAEVLSFVAAHKDWIHKARAKVASLVTATRPQFADGDKVQVLGEQKTLRVRPSKGLSLDKGNARVDGDDLILEIRPGASASERRRTVERLHGELARRYCASLIKQWEPVMGRRASKVDYRQMKSRWGSCQPRTGRICFNTELGRMSVSEIEYVVVHELAHLWVRGHGRDFQALMSRHMPDWKARRRALNSRERKDAD